MFSAGRISLLVIAVLVWANPAIATECGDCHAEVFNQLKGPSHHIQGTSVSSKHCYACHWEATSDGQVNEKYHEGQPAKVKKKLVNLVVWSDGKRPTAYILDKTATTFSPANLSTVRERPAVAAVTRHCLGCHSDQNNDIRPFAGDSRTPRAYAWDGQSVASRYSHKGVAPWGKYSTATTNKKKGITKAYSAHGNATANQGGWSPESGYDDEIPITRGNSGTKNIECFDCHNTHGSAVSGVTSSYRTYNGSFNGAILKETQAGKGGYQVTYRPSDNLDPQSKNPYNAGSGLCFDCHETAKEGTTPWGYNSTFGAEQPIMGYKDTHRFGSGVKGSTARYPNRKTRTEVASSHLKSGKFLNYSAQGKIHGLCTPCHDPHGISVTLGDRMPYALPLLKGTWLTSPYRADGLPSGLPDNDSGKATGNAKPYEQYSFQSMRQTGGSNAPREPMQGVRYSVDRNTFGENGQITEDDLTFAGLCLKCHGKENLKADSDMGLIHRAVKGWGSNKEHAFPCSKCHQAHNSGLPRLMQTNCFEKGPSGLRENSGLPWAPFKTGKKQTRTGSFPASGAASSKIVGCHVKQFGKPAVTSKREAASDQWQTVAAW